MVKYLFLIFSSITLFIAIGCNTKEAEPRQYQHNIEEYDEPSDYYVSTREDFRRFLDNHYASFKERLPEIRKKEDFLNNFIENPNILKQYIPWITKKLKNYNQHFPIQTIHNVFNFHLHLSNKKTPKGLFIYVHDDLTVPYLGWDFLVEFSQYLEDFNFISVDLSNVTKTEKVYTEKDLSDLFTKELKQFLKDQNLTYNNLIMNVTCRSFIFIGDFLKNKENHFYDKAILYTPMVKKSKDDKILPKDKIYPKNKKFMKYYDMSNFYQLPRNNNQGQKVVPCHHLDLNFKTMSNMAKAYFKGTDIKNIKSPYLIYPEYEDILTFQSMASSEFPPENIFMLKDMYHNDYYTHKELRKRYFLVIDQIIRSEAKSK